MKLRWEKYWYDLSSSILKHIGTALAGWGGVNIAHASGVSVPALDWKALGIFILAAGVIPAVAAFWQKTPLPEIEETTTTVTITKVKTKEEGKDETKPADTPAGDGGVHPGRHD